MANDLTLYEGTATYSATAKAGSAKSGSWMAHIPDAAVPWSVSGSALTVGTIEMWVSNTPGALKIFASHPNLWWFGVDASGNLIAHYGMFNPTNNEMSLNSTTVVSTGAYVHVALVFNFTNGVGSASLYAAGNRVATSTTYVAPGSSSAVGNSGCVIGGLGTLNTYDWTGLIDEVVITSAAKYTGATYTIPASPAATTAPNQTAYYALDNNLLDSNVLAGTLTISAPNVAGLIAGGTSTISGTFTGGAPTGLSQVLDATTTAVATPTITTTSGSAATAVGTYSYTITTPATGAHSIQVNGTGTYAATGSPTSFTLTATATILPNDANIIYSPGCWDITSTRAKTIQAGAEFRALITGSATAVALGFDVSGASAPLSQVVVRVDRGPPQVFPIAASVTLTLPGGNTWGSHLLEIVVKSMSETISRWTTQTTAVLFTGITTTPGTCATLALPARPLKGLVFGDSITEGVRTLNLNATNDTDRNDATLGWAYNLGSLLGAEVGVVGFGGTGWLASGSGGVPAITATNGTLWNAGPSRVFVGLDFIVINHGTNDTTNNTASAVTSVLNGLLTAAPGAIIFLMRPFNGTLQAANLQAGRLACSNPQRVIYVDTNGWLASGDSSDGTHPYGYINVASLAPRLAGVIRSTLRGVVNRWSH